MRSNPQTRGALANPVMVGAVTTLVTLVAVVLAYNANSGLPFVPTYNITAVVPDAAELVKGNEVRVGGKRVGVITEITAREGGENGSPTPTAELSLKLDKTVEPLPRDTVITVRPRSPLGLRYLELRPGRSRSSIPAGGRIPLRRARPIVELDEVINAFDAHTREGIRGVLRGLGDGLAGRGGDLNRAFEALGPLVAVVEPVSRNLASPRTDLAGLIRGLQATTAAIAPVAPTLGRLFENGAITLAAVAAADEALRELLREAPPTEAVATRVLRGVRPVLAESAELLRDLGPGVALLPTASRRLARAAEAGTPVLRRSVKLSGRLEDALAAIDALLRDPATPGSLRELRAVVASLARTLRFVNPLQVRCNYLGLWTRNASSAISEGDENGTWFRFIGINQPDEIFQRSDPAPELHVNLYPDTGAGGECEAGNESWLPGQRIGNPPGDQGSTTELTAPPAGVGGR